jgi:hypothetical protein
MEDVLKVKVRINPLALLSSTGEAEFQHLKKRPDLSDGNLSFHLRVLGEAVSIQVNKTFITKKPKTFIKTTPKGWKTVIEYREDLPKIYRTGG